MRRGACGVVALASLLAGSAWAVEAVPRGSGPAAAFAALAPDAGWCWFGEPRAVFHAGERRRTYAGFITRHGDVRVAAYDHERKTTETFTLHAGLERDDHDNPSLLVRRDGHLMAFYSRHAGAELFLRISERPESIDRWGPEVRLALNPTGAGAVATTRSSYTYPSPVQLADENGRIYLFWRGERWKPTFATSDDGGKTWSNARVLFAAPGAKDEQRPYVKVTSDGKGTIHFAFTDGHPRDEARNSVYYVRYRAGRFERADGRVVGDLGKLPLDPRAADVVYDGRKTGVRAWVWDLAVDKDGRPVVAYTRLPAESDHRYAYARWAGSSWEDHEITAAGGWFPRTPLGQAEREPHYSPGLALDPEDPSVVYLAKPIEGAYGRVREIERWVTRDGGATFRGEAVTRNSHADNVRPFVVRQHAPDGPTVLWLHLPGAYEHYTSYRSELRMDLPAPVPLSAALEPAAVREAMRRVADWQLAHPSKHDPRDWVQGALYTGLLAWAELTNDPRPLDELRRRGEENGWRLGDWPYHADHHVVGQLYLGLWARDGDPKQLAGVKRRFDWILEHPSQASLEFVGPEPTNRWSWCDALFMAPLTWLRLANATGERRYLDFMLREWWATTALLYDETEHLYFRDSRFFARREANGRKIFWSRGNGWVFAGLARVIEELPTNHADRPRFVRLFREMADALARAQQPDGLWRVGLLDPKSWPYPETSGSAFFAFGFASGINQGLLDRRRYEPVVRRAWPALVAAVREDGRIGSVQPIGDAPRSLTRDMTELYGAGAFLLAGAELHELLTTADALAEVRVTNPLGEPRPAEIVEVPLPREDVQVIDARTGRALVSQALGGKLLFQVALGANETRRFWLRRRRDDVPVEALVGSTFARVVPERKDDLAWENDRVAFRVYGPALERDGEVSSGVDLWSKRVPTPVIDRFYAAGDYHEDHGEGGDFYKVGPSRGCGGTAIFDAGGAPHVSRNWAEAKIVATGPLRVVFELAYAPVELGGARVRETKRVSLDLGSHLTRFETTVEGAGAGAKVAGVKFGAGIVRRPGDQPPAKDEGAGWLAYWEPSDPAHGTNACGVVWPRGQASFLEAEGNAFLTAPLPRDGRVVHFAGGAWDRAGHFPDAEAWARHLAGVARRLAAPVRVQVMALRGGPRQATVAKGN